MKEGVWLGLIAFRLPTHWNQTSECLLSAFGKTKRATDSRTQQIEGNQNRNKAHILQSETECTNVGRITQYIASQSQVRKKKLSKQTKQRPVDGCELKEKLREKHCSSPCWSNARVSLYKYWMERVRRTRRRSCCNSSIEPWDGLNRPERLVAAMQQHSLRLLQSARLLFSNDSLLKIINQSIRTWTGNHSSDDCHWNDFQFHSTEFY